MKFNVISLFPAVLLCLFCGLYTPQVHAHGSVVLGGDVCLINIGFLEAHFTVFQPETRENTEYCENIPDVTRSVFVMEYLHQMLPSMLIDFRIIRDIDSLGRYADWSDVQAIADLDAVTVYYDPPRIEDGGYYQSSYAFEERGDYIAIVTAQHPTEDRNYNAVFYFRVGPADLGTVPLFIALLLLLQLGYWWSNGGYKRLKARRAAQSRHPE